MARTIGFGRSGVGKSWFFGWYLERTLSDFDYAVHFDIEDEEQGLSDKHDSLLKTFYVDREFYEQEVNYNGRVMPLVTAVVLENKKLRIVPDGLTPGEQRDLFAQICGLSMKIAKTGPTFHVSSDEAHQVLPEVGDSLDDRVKRMLTGGRKKGVEWAFFTQRPANLHQDAFTQANFAVYFSLTKDVDLAKVNGSAGFNAYTHLPKLGNREYILENLDSGELARYTTDELERERQHFAGDDGIADEALMSSVESGERLRHVQDEVVAEDEEAEG